MSSFDTPLSPDGTPPQRSVEHAASVPTADERTLAMLAELLQLFSWLVGPLIIYFVKRDSPFVRFHAMQAVLWQALMVIVFVVGFAFMVPALILTQKSAGAPPAFPLIFFFGIYGVFGLVWLANFVVAIYFAVKANSGAWATYPVLGRLARKIVGI